MLAPRTTSQKTPYLGVLATLEIWVNTKLVYSVKQQFGAGAALQLSAIIVGHFKLKSHTAKEVQCEQGRSDR